MRVSRFSGHALFAADRQGKNAGFSSNRSEEGSMSLCSNSDDIDLLPEAIRYRLKS